jgi:hypothetical protein
MHLMRSVGHSGYLVATEFGMNVAPGQIVDFDETDATGLTIGEMLTGREMLYEPASTTHTVTVTLTHAQILALPDTPVVLLPPTETPNSAAPVTTLPVVESAFITQPAWAAAYLNPDGGTCDAQPFLSYGTDNSWNAISSPVVNQLLANVQAAVWKLVPMNVALANWEGAAQLVPLSQLLLMHDNGVSLVVNQPTVAGALTGGDPTNTLIVTLTYRVLNVLTGAFQ